MRLCIKRACRKCNHAPEAVAYRYGYAVAEHERIQLSAVFGIRPLLDHSDIEQRFHADLLLPDEKEEVLGIGGIAYAVLPAELESPAARGVGACLACRRRLRGERPLEETLYCFERDKCVLALHGELALFVCHRFRGFLHRDAVYSGYVPYRFRVRHVA